ncbi:MAG: hypothetical protein HKO79_00785 [Desulfobacterales bacterium]|nr:hypothetical protein [Desulfobacterales bacterium]
MTEINEDVWVVEDLDTDITLGIFSSKYRALRAIDLWKMVGTEERYIIKTDLASIKPLNGESEFIVVDMVRSDKRKTLFVHKRNFNSGVAMLNLR